MKMPEQVLSSYITYGAVTMVYPPRFIAAFVTLVNRPFLAVTFCTSVFVSILVFVLVLVHGLNGDPIQTWSGQEGAKGWPQTLLPGIQPQTRVPSFGYNADIYRSNSAVGIRDNARAMLSHLRAPRRGPQATERPIVSPGHCLGGLIAKQAMAFANSERERKEVALATKTIQIFFGTPHFGGDKERLKFLAGQFGFFADSKNGKVSPLVNAMTEGAPDISEIEEDFRHHAHKYRISSNYETGICDGADRLIVDKTSAMMGIEDELEAMGGDHRTMCHFEDPEDPDFMRICQLSEDAYDEAPSKPVAPVPRPARTEAPAKKSGDGVARLEGRPAVPPAEVQAMARLAAAIRASGETSGETFALVRHQSRTETPDKTLSGGVGRRDDSLATPPTGVKASARPATIPVTPGGTTTISSTTTILESRQIKVERASAMPVYPALPKAGAE
ncbi:hypothetical protein RB594_004839 [Gaeumannomyces avenae]